MFFFVLFLLSLSIMMIALNASSSTAVGRPRSQGRVELVLRRTTRGGGGGGEGRRRTPSHPPVMFTDAPVVKSAWRIGRKRLFQP